MTGSCRKFLYGHHVENQSLMSKRLHEGLECRKWHDERSMFSPVSGRRGGSAHSERDGRSRLVCVQSWGASRVFPAPIAPPLHRSRALLAWSAFGQCASIWERRSTGGCQCAPFEDHAFAKRLEFACPGRTFFWGILLCRRGQLLNQDDETHPFPDPNAERRAHRNSDERPGLKHQAGDLPDRHPGPLGVQSPPLQLWRDHAGRQPREGRSEAAIPVSGESHP